MAQPSHDQPTWGSLEDATVAAAAAVLPELLRHKATATNAGAAVFPLGRLAAWNPEDPTSVGTPEQHARVALLPRVLAALSASYGVDDARSRRDLELIAAGRGREVPLTKEHMHPLFPQARELRMGNYGSYGGCPLPVTACQHAYQVCTVDGDADRFMLRQVFGSIEDAHRVMAHYLGLRDSSNIAFVDNAAAAFNTIAESVIFNPTFYTQRHPITAATAGQPRPPLRIMVMSSGYPMVSNVVRFWTNRHNMLRAALPPGVAASALWEYQVDVCPLTAAMVESLETDAEVLMAEMVAFAAAHEADVVIFDHCAFAPAFVYPVVELSRRLKAARPGCFICVDGAHSIGALDLSGLFSADAADNGEVAFDAWFSNNHKWLMAPKAHSVLWFNDRWKTWMHPCVKSNLYRGTPHGTSAEEQVAQRESLSKMSSGFRVPAGDAPDAQRRAEFYWQGARDHSATLAIVDLVWFRRQLGEDRIYARLHELAMTGAQAMAAVWGTEVLLKSGTFIGPMSSIRLPTDDAAEVRAVSDWLSLQHAIHIPTMTLGNGHMYCRIAPQIFSDVADFEGIAHRFTEGLAHVRATVVPIPS